MKERTTLSGVLVIPTTLVRPGTPQRPRSRRVGTPGPVTSVTPGRARGAAAGGDGSTGRQNNGKYGADQPERRSSEIRERVSSAASATASSGSTTTVTPMLSQGNTTMPLAASSSRLIPG